ncbi:MAG TPA: cytochrome P450 [Xanthobacteraceae bacterium]|nr:cytochrome P450 [Xanthobacteraceae bacterium]
MSERPPVTDWATDFDHLDPRWSENPYPIWDELRQTCPIAHTDRFLGTYFPSRYEDVRAIAYDTEHFSSRRPVVREVRPPLIPAPPITSDPPEHKPAKQILLPAFTPEAVERIEPRTRGICRELVGRIADKGACDAAVAYAQEIPVRVIAHMLGVPEQDGDLFRKWIKEILEIGITDYEVLMRAQGEMTAYFAEKIAARRTSPGEDLIGYLVNVRVADRPLSDAHINGTLRLVLIAGIDTTWSAIGSCLWHLAQHPQDRRRLIAESGLMASAIEEFLRAYAPVTMAREVVKETQIAGCTFKPGHMILLSFPAANRDPAMFADANQVIIDRTQNRHAAFGLGIHRCVGSNLARMEIGVALAEWLARIPEFRIDPNAPVTWSKGTVRGPRELPLLLSA